MNVSRIKFIKSDELTVSGKIVNLKLFPHNYSWIDGGKFNLKISHYFITQTIMKHYNEDTDTHHMIVHEFEIYDLSGDIKIIEVLRMGLLDPQETIDLVNSISDFNAL